MPVQATSSKPSSFLNIDIQEAREPESSSKFSERINPLETGGSTQFWEERGVEFFGCPAVQQLSEGSEKKEIKVLLASYCSAWSIVSNGNKQDTLYYVTTSSDLGNGRLPQNESEWTLKIHDPEMKDVIAKCTMRSPIVCNSSYRQHERFYIIDIRTIEERDYIIVPVAESIENDTIYDIFCFDRNTRKLTKNIGSVNNPIFMKNYLVSWRSVDPLRNRGVSFATYTLRGTQLAEQFVEDCCDVMTDELTIYFGSPKHPVTGSSWAYSSNIYGTIEENPLKKPPSETKELVKKFLIQKFEKSKGRLIF